MCPVPINHQFTHGCGSRNDPTHPIMLSHQLIYSDPFAPIFKSILLGSAMKCTWEPRNSLACSFTRLLHSNHTIMIFVMPASTNHFLWTMAIKHLMLSFIIKRQNGTSWGALFVWDTSHFSTHRIRVVSCAYCSPQPLPAWSYHIALGVHPSFTIITSLIHHVGSLPSTTHNFARLWLYCYLPW